MSSSSRPPSSADLRSVADEWPAVYDRFTSLRGGNELGEYLTQQLPDRRTRAVDLGTGPGRHAAVLAEHFDYVLAVDNDEAMIRYARLHRPAPNVEYVRLDLRHVNVSDFAPFDFVASVMVVHHIPDLVPALVQIRDLVAVGGIVVLVDRVDERGRVPRAWLIEEASRALRADLDDGRPQAEAAARYEASTHPTLLDRFSSDTFLPPGEFERYYGGVFQGATFTPLLGGLGMGMWWRREAEGDPPWPLRGGVARDMWWQRETDNEARWHPPA